MAPELTSIIYMITTACNRKCPSCTCRIPDLALRHCTPEDVQRLLPLLGPIAVMGVSGGEPTLHPRFADVSRAFAQARNCGSLNLATNGAKLLEHDDVLDCYDNIGLAHYTEATYPGSKNNDALVRQIEEAFKTRKQKKPSLVVWPVTHRTTLAPGHPPCHKYLTSALVLDDQIYPCCSLPTDAQSVAIEPGWRERWSQLKPACDTCLVQPNRGPLPRC